MLDKDKFHSICPTNKDPQGWSDVLLVVLPKHGIDTPKRIAAFLAQCSHESLDFTTLKENLNYSEKGLLTVFRKYFDATSAAKYARKPEAIASRVYANRMGNGNETSGEGWKYRGRGPIQLTGKANYIAFATAMGVDITNPDIVALDKETAILSAIWFWNKNKLNDYADKGDIKGMTKVINGGYLGLDDRLVRYEKAIKVLA